MQRTLWKNKNIVYYLFSGGISRLGDVLSGLAFLFLAYDLTGSKVLTTGMAIAETLPYLLFGLVGGVIADWMPKKKLLVWLDLARIPLVLSIVLLFYLGFLTYTCLLIVSFLIQCIGCFFNPAHRTVLPLLTNEQERTAVNSFYDSLTRGVTILSPVVSIWLLQTYGVIHFFTIDAITYATSAICISQIKIPTRTLVADKSLRTLVQSISEFFIWAKKQTTLRRLFTFTFITVFFNTWVWEVGLLLALSEISSNSEELFSGLQGVFGIAVILTNIILPFFTIRMTFSFYLLGVCIWGIGITYYGILFDVPHFFIGCIIVGIGLPIASLTRVYLLQTLVPEEKMGRAFSSNAVLLYFSNTISLALYSLLLSFFSIQKLMVGSGLLILITGILGIFLSVNRTENSRRFMINLFK